MNVIQKLTLLLIPVILIAFGATDAAAQKTEFRTWTIGGQSVEAKLVDYNGKQVLLQDADLFQEVFSLTELSSQDTRYVRSKVNELKLKLRSDRILHGIDVWKVNMMQNGQPFFRNYQGVSSSAAMAAAGSEFPNAMIQGVVKISNENRGPRARLRLKAQTQRQAAKQAAKAQAAQKKAQKKQGQGKGKKKKNEDG